jgi:hypothetical protein
MQLVTPRKEKRNNSKQAVLLLRGMQASPVCLNTSIICTLPWITCRPSHYGLLDQQTPQPGPSYGWDEINLVGGVYLLAGWCQPLK